MFLEPQRLESPVTGAILAGGASRRMGQPKEGVRLWDGRPMMAHVLDALASVCQRIVVVGHCVGYDIPETHPSGRKIIHIPDRHSGLGPLAALDALLSSDLSSRYLVATCDQPLLRPELLQLLLNEAYEEQGVFFQAQNGEELDPFPGLYPAAMLPVVQQALTDGQYAVRSMLRRVPLRWVALPDDLKICLSNINTPDAVDALNLSQTCRKEPVA